MKTETQYLLRRASEEAQAAISSPEPAAADAHEALSICYSAKAVLELVAEDDEPSTAPSEAARRPG